MQRAPKGFRLHIGLFGRRNVGKSSLLNAITRQQVSIVSAQAGTTTDPVEKPMEFLPLGPVLFIDTAGLDDSGDLGSLRVERSRKVLDRTELAIVISDGVWGDFEHNLVRELQARSLPIIAVFNKQDQHLHDQALLRSLTQQGLRVVQSSALQGQGILDLREAILHSVPASHYQNRPILADLVPQEGTVILVVPIDKEAPKGRIILPQVQVIRELLDHEQRCMVVTEKGLPGALASLKNLPSIVVTDSQAFAQVAAQTPEDVPLTSFSILFARLKGDLFSLVQGSLAIGSLRAGDQVLVAEACSHHPIEGDIGREKIPRLLQPFGDGALTFTTVQGHDFPENLSDFALVVHCGGCVHNRQEMLTRIARCQHAGVPITNYGLSIAYALGILPRVLAPFTELAALLHEPSLTDSGREFFAHGAAVS